MTNRDTDEKLDKGKLKQSIGGQQSHRSEVGAQGDQTDGSEGQPIGGNDSNTGSGTTLTAGYDLPTGGQVATGQAQPGAGSEPPRSMGTHGSEFGQFADDTGPAGQQGQSGTGQADLGTQADSTLAGRSDQQDISDVDPPASYGGGVRGRQPNTQGEGFILAQGSGSDDLQQRESPASADATGGSDFAEQGRGALDVDSDEEDRPA